MKRMPLGNSDNEEGEGADAGSRNYRMDSPIALFGMEVRKYAMRLKTDRRCFYAPSEHSVGHVAAVIIWRSIT